MRQAYKGQLEELLEKVEVYEQLLHDIQMYAAVTLDQPAVAHLIDLVCAWSYAHRCGNGEYSDKEQNQLIKRQFERLKDREYSKSQYNSNIDTEHKQRYRQSLKS